MHARGPPSGRSHLAEDARLDEPLESARDGAGERACFPGAGRSRAARRARDNAGGAERVMPTADAAMALRRAARCLPGALARARVNAPPSAATPQWIRSRWDAPRLPESNRPTAPQGPSRRSYRLLCALTRRGARSCRRDVLLALLRFRWTHLTGSNARDRHPFENGPSATREGPVGVGMARATASLSFARVRGPPGGSQGPSRSP